MVIRLSSLGDVALTVPVFRTLEGVRPEERYLVITQPDFQPLFSTLSNVDCYGADIYGRHRGASGLVRLYRELRRFEPAEVVDLHNTLRSDVLCRMFRLEGRAVAVYDKKRSLRSRVLQGKAPPESMPHVTRQYLEVFRCNAPLCSPPWIDPSDLASEGLPEMAGKWIGVAPFSRHVSKEWPHTHMRSLLLQLNRARYGICCFAFSPREMEIAAAWKQDIPDLQVMDRSYSLDRQLSLIGRLSALITMDSASLHLAGLVNTPTVSIWGATHPDMGFGPISDRYRTLYQGGVPLSVYGAVSGSEAREAERRMSEITPEAVIDALEQLVEGA